MDNMESKEALEIKTEPVRDVSAGSPANEPTNVEHQSSVNLDEALKKLDLEAEKSSQTGSDTMSDAATLETEATREPSPSMSPTPHSSGFPRSDYVPPLPGTGMDATNVFIKYLPTDMTNTGLFTLFSQFGEITSCKVMVDPITGYSLGYGFVRFSSAEEAANAIQTMYGMTIGTKTLLCKLSHGIPQNNATPSDNLYIKPLLDTTSESDLMDLFSPHGRVLECKVMLDKNTGQSRQIGFVRFATIDEATKALAANNGRYLTEDAPPMVVKYAESRPQKIARRAKLLANQAAAESRRTAAQMKLQQQQQAEMMAAEAAMAAHAGDGAQQDVSSGAQLSSNSGEISSNSNGIADVGGASGAGAGEAPTSRPYIVKDEYGNVTFAPDLDEMEGHGATVASTAPMALAAPYWQPNNYPTLPYASHGGQEATRGGGGGGGRSGRNHSTGHHGGRNGRHGQEQSHRNGRVYYGGHHGGQMAGEALVSNGEVEGAEVVPGGGMGEGSGSGRNEHHGHTGPVYRKKGSHHVAYAPRQGNASSGVSSGGQAALLPTFRDSPTQRVQLAGKVEVDEATGELVAPEWADDPTRLFISHLPAEYDANGLQSLFESHGTVTSAKISQDKRSARPKTYGFVQFSTPAEAAQAVKALHGTLVDGRAINVAFEATQSVAKHKHELQQYYYLQQAATLPNGAFYPPPPPGTYPRSNGPRHPRNPRSRPPRTSTPYTTPYYPASGYDLPPESPAAPPFMYLVDPTTGVPYPVPLYYPGMPLPSYPAQLDGSSIPEYYPSTQGQANNDQSPAPTTATSDSS